MPPDPPYERIAGREERWKEMKNYLRSRLCPQRHTLKPAAGLDVHCVIGNETKKAGRCIRSVRSGLEVQRKAGLRLWLCACVDLCVCEEKDFLFKEENRIWSQRITESTQYSIVVAPPQCCHHPPFKAAHPNLPTGHRSTESLEHMHTKRQDRCGNTSLFTPKIKIYQ